MMRPRVPRGYLSDASAFWAAPSDPRFSYCLYVPRLRHAGSRILVHIHGSHRTPETFRDLMAPFAEETGTIILCPLFPCGVADREDTSSYKRVFHEGLRYDLVLLDMVADAERRLGLATGRFVLAGFSGGGQFVQRFILAHPGRLLAASVGAPGLVTLLDPELPWWRGLRGLEAVIGAPVDMAALAALPLQVLVGDQDIRPEGVQSRPGSTLWMEGINDTGATRLERAAAFVESLRARGLTPRHDVIPGVGHDGFAMLDPMLDFVRPILTKLGEAQP
ncbi:alpha/beta hydrolase [Aureimonas populi]|uniref:Alpha/beta hydrolase n=1 Tax=Aureimonas populi TaxID=1701758 RepID=A0ABW5CLW7_9HYPH|nr:alpha/beta hydrolase [Aureimonas populi]